MKVLIVGDSRKMKGGVNTVIRSIEKSFLWDKYNMFWVECQINSTKLEKILYLFKGIIVGIIKIPFYHIIYFQTTPTGLKRLCILFFAALLLRKKIIIHLHVGNQLLNYQNDQFFKFCCNKSDAIITLGKTFTQYVPVRDKSKVHFLYNPAPPVEEPTIGQKYFLFAAYIDAENNKGYDTLIRGFAKVVKSHPEWKLVICGTGAMENLYRLIQENGVENNVETPGWVEGEEKKSYFKNAYAYIMTSRMEGLPMSIIEAMAYGKPIITTAVGCLPEFLTNRESALFFDFNDYVALANCMNELIDNNSLYENLCVNEQIIIREIFSIRLFLENLNNLFMRTIKHS